MKMKKIYARTAWTALLTYAAANVLCADSGKWTFLILAPALFCLLCQIRKWYERGQDGRLPDRKALFAVSAAFGVLTIIGKNYNKADNWSVLFKSRSAVMDTALQMFGMAVLAFFAAQAVILLYRRYPVREGSGRKRFLFWWLVFALVWLPYLIVNYPGHIMGDTCSQIPMAFNMPNKFSLQLVRISEDIMLTNHHPVLHTLMLGAGIRLGRLLFHSDTVGLFICTLVQYLVMTCIYGYAISWLERKKAPLLLVVITALIWLVVPNYPEYAILATKDGLFSSFLLLYGIRTADLLIAKKEDITRKDLVMLLITAVCCMLLRNNGFYIIFLSLPFLAIALRSVRRQLLLMTALVLVLHVGYTRALLPALKITPGNTRELLSIPLQQTARYFVEFKDTEVTQEERDTFSKVVNLEGVYDSYTPVKADAVKAQYLNKTAGEHLDDFFRLWLSILRRHPGSCIQATLCSLNGYYSFQDKAVWNYKITGALKQAKRIREESGFDFVYPEKFDSARRWICWKMREWKDNPVIYLLMSAAFYNWILVYILWLSLTRKCWKVLALFMPPAIALLTALAGPMNAATYYRYEYPVAVVLPLLVGVLICYGRSLRQPE